MTATGANSTAVLADLAREINQHDRSKRACEVKGVMHLLRMGELLIEAKKVAPHGTFRAWVKEKFTFSQRAAQIYMALARDKRIVGAFADEYETVSHLTLTQAVKLARRHKAFDERTKEIKDHWKRAKDNQRDMATTLAEAQKCFEGDTETFKKWLVEAVQFSPNFAETVLGLLGKDYDGDAWLDAFLTDIEAGTCPWVPQGDQEAFCGGRQ